MLVVELIIVLLAIFLGARLGNRYWFCRRIGVLVLAAIGVKPGNIPFDVISIIMAVIAAISAMQVAGGLDYLVHQTEKLLRRNPKYITILAPIVTYFLTIFAGTGNISLATLPVIAEVAKEQGVKPCRPLSTAVVSAQIAITASPISAAVVYMSSVMEGHGISYLHLLSVVIPSTLLAVLVMSFRSLCCSTPNSLTIRFIASVWKRARLNCAVKSRLKSNPVQNVRLAVPAGRSWRGYLCNHQQPKHGSG